MFRAQVRLRASLTACALVLAACGESDPGSRPSESALLLAPPPPGTELPKPGGGTFFLDPNQGGQASNLRLAEVFWGRLVDVHDLDGDGHASAEPRFRDLVVNENVQTDGTNYTLVTSAATGRTRLVVHRKHGTSEYDSLLRLAMGGLPPIIPKHDDGSSPPPFSLVPRNACLVARLDDCLADDAQAAQQLRETVRVLAGYPPRVPFEARILFDPNHGALAAGAFHSTRVLIDLAVSEPEAEANPYPLPVNFVGLPASNPDSSAASVSLRIPTEKDPGSGQFQLLRNLAGSPLSTVGNGPIDTTVPTLEVVRAMRAGNETDQNNGFLLDLEQPQLVGSMPVTVTRARSVNARIFLVDLAFATPCRLVPRVPDVLEAGEHLLEVLDSGSPDRNGVRKLRVRASEPISDPSVLLGNGALLATYSPARAPGLHPACWVSFLPGPSLPPAAGVSTAVQVAVRFTEPMDPEPLESLDGLLIVRGLALPGIPPDATRIVVGEVLSSNDLGEFRFSPLLPLAHAPGIADPYHVELANLRDLAGNRLRHELPAIDFRLDPAEAQQSNGSLVLRFGSFDEVPPIGLPDLRGQFFLDPGREVIVPRPVSFTSWAVDRTNPVPALMLPVAGGVFTPLNPLGSKLQTLWRYCDVGWNVRDESKYNLDVSGLAWAPFGGVLADHYPQFEIALAHSRFLPDEVPAGAAPPRPKWPSSGLRGAPSPFTANILVDPAGPQRIVHPRTLGYTVRPADLFLSSTGTALMPYPVNRGAGPLVTYTWRDTAVLAKGGPDNHGVPLDIEVVAGVEAQAGTLAGSGQLPSIGLPLLMEYRCFPSDTGLGFNLLGIQIGNSIGDPLPAFRAYSSGGINTLGSPVLVNPDTELFPRGGFNPAGTPPGSPTQFSAESVFYLGQLDTVTRLSRVHTVWLDTSFAQPSYLEPFVAPFPHQQPAGTAIVLDYRGATGFSANASPFDATQLDAYGDVRTGTVTFHGGLATWTGDIGSLDGARYLQVRLTFRNDVETGASAELSTLGLAFAED